MTDMRGDEVGGRGVRDGGTAHLVLLLGGAGGRVGEMLLRRLSPEVGDAHVAYVDLDRQDLADYAGKNKFCLGVDPDEARSRVEPKFLAMPDCPRVFQTIAADASLNAVWSQGTAAGARRQPIYTVASNAVHGDALPRWLRAQFRRLLRRKVSIQLHFVMSGAGGSGSGLLMLLLDLLALQAERYPTRAGVRLFVVNAIHFVDDEAMDLTDEDRARMCAIQALVDERIDRSTSARSAGRIPDIVVECPPARAGDEGGDVLYSREEVESRFAAVLAALVKSGVVAAAPSADANVLEHRHQTVDRKED